MNWIRGASAVSFATTLSIALAVGAHAAPQDDAHAREAISALVEQHAPDVDTAALSELRPTESSVHSETQAGPLVIPLDPTEPIELGDGSLRLSLPAELAQTSAAPTSTGEVVFLGETSDLSGTATALDGGVRVVTVIDSPSAAHDLTYQVSGAQPELADDGSILLFKHQDVREVTGTVGQVRVADGYVEAPWAVDSSGRPVPTHFEVNGDSFTQVVTPDDATVYPIIADPTAWWGQYWNISAANANRLAAVLTAGSGVAAVVSVLLALGVVSSPGAVATGIASGLMAIGGGVIAFCNASGRGIVIKKPRVGPMWCESR